MPVTIHKIDALANSVNFALTTSSVIGNKTTTRYVTLTRSQVEALLTAMEEAEKKALDALSEREEIREMPSASAKSPLFG